MRNKSLRLRALALGLLAGLFGLGAAGASLGAAGASLGAAADPSAVALVAARAGSGATPPPAGSTAGESGSAARWRWPLDGVPRIVRRFEPPANPYGPGHRGVDLAAEPGVPVRAAGAGVVWFAGLVGGLGVVSVKHADGRRTTYEPIHPSVRTGSVVAAGTVLGPLGLGHPGCPAVACLHWGLLDGDVYLDPLTLLNPARVRLLPLDARQPAR